MYLPNKKERELIAKKLDETKEPLLYVVFKNGDDITEDTMIDSEYNVFETDHDRPENWDDVTDDVKLIIINN